MADVIKTEEGKNIIVNKIHIIAVDRSSKDIRHWRNAHINAEAVVYANRQMLYDLYKDVELDGHLSGLVQKRFDAVLNKQLRYEVGGKKVDEMDDVIDSEVFRKIITKILETKLWGLSGMEFIPGEDLCFEEIPRKHIKPQWSIIAFEQSGQEGFPYQGVQNLWIVGEKQDLGLYLKCAPYVLYKKGNMADWAQYIEIFGQPIRVVKYDAHDEETKLELQEVLDESGSSLALMIPKQADFEIMDGKASNADGQLQERFKNACDNELSIIILGNTETTSNTNGGSNAKAQEQGRQQLEVTKSDMAFVSKVLSSKQAFAIFKSYGLKVSPGGKFVFEKDINLAELSSRKDIDIALSAKIPISDDYFYETYSIPKPDNYEELKRKMEEEKAAKLAPPAPAPAPGKPAPAKKQKPLSADDPFALEENDSDIVAKVKTACRNFLTKLNFFAPALDKEG